MPAYCTYHLVNFGCSGVMLSLPTASKTLGLISPDRMFCSSSPEAPLRPENVYPCALVNAGETILEFRNFSEEA